jgi:hypothetical protein
MDIIPVTLPQFGNLVRYLRRAEKGSEKWQNLTEAIYRETWQETIESKQKDEVYVNIV